MVAESITREQAQNQRKPQKRQTTRNQRRTATFYLLVSPWLIGFVLLGIIPFVIGLLTSFTNYDGLNISNFKFIGLDNYARAFDDLEVAFSAKRTLLWGAINLPTWLILSFGLAVILNQKVKGRGIFRTVFYLPSLIPIAAAVTAWRVILERNFGMLNHLISQLTPEPVAIGWFSDFAMPGMTTIAVWAGLGAGMVIFLAGLQGIPDELLEASRIDGASHRQSFRHVTLPLMTPVIFFQLVMGLIAAFQQLNLPMIMTGVAMTSTSVPPRSIYLYMIHTYRQIFTFGRYGYGTALLWMLFLAIVGLTVFVFWSEKYWVYSGSSSDGQQS